MTLKIVDPAPYKSLFRSQGLSLDLLAKCNSQEFKSIDGFGRGYFLIESSTPMTTPYVEFTDGEDFSVNLIVLDRLNIDHPNASTYVYALLTAEPKHVLDRYIVSRNYNVVNRTTLDTGTLEFEVLDPDTDEPLSLEDLLADLLNGTELNLEYDAGPIALFDVFIQGKTVREAIDHLCAIYGLIWTADNQNAYIFSLTESSGGSGSSSGVGGGGGGFPDGIEDPINDSRQSITDVAFNVKHTTFPVLPYCLKDPLSYHTVTDSTDEGEQGRAIGTYDPYFYAIAADDGEIINEDELDDRATDLQENVEALGQLLDTYVAKHLYEMRDLSETPAWLSVIYADLGSGPRSIYRSPSYPWEKPPTPVRADRMARNWVGTLAEAYDTEDEPAPILKVTPSYGLDGEIPEDPGGGIDVENEYNWDYGEVGWKIRVEWDCNQSRWIPITQEYDCPEDTETSGG